MRKRFRRNYTEDFLFMDDDVIPTVELRQSGACGFCPDVTWFIQPGVATERCDSVDFANSLRRGETGRERGVTGDRKSKAWRTLRNKCMPRVHGMRALEMKTFGGKPKVTFK
jgi:hypothetical protein